MAGLIRPFTWDAMHRHLRQTRSHFHVKKKTISVTLSEDARDNQKSQ